MKRGVKVAFDCSMHDVTAHFVAIEKMKTALYRVPRFCGIAMLHLIIVEMVDLGAQQGFTVDTESLGRDLSTREMFHHIA